MTLRAQTDLTSFGFNLLVNLSLLKEKEVLRTSTSDEIKEYNNQKHISNENIERANVQTEAKG